MPPHLSIGGRNVAQVGDTEVVELISIGTGVWARFRILLVDVLVRRVVAGFKDRNWDLVDS